MQDDVIHLRFFPFPTSCFLTCLGIFVRRLSRLASFTAFLFSYTIEAHLTLSESGKKHHTFRSALISSLDSIGFFFRSLIPSSSSPSLEASDPVVDVLLLSSMTLGTNWTPKRVRSQ